MLPLTVRYAYSRHLQEAANCEGRNYWYAYVEELLSRLGVCARPIELAACGDPGALAKVGVLVLGDFAASELPAGAAEALAEWAAEGGVLIGFATEGLDALFGVGGSERVPQARGPFAINGYLELGRSPVAEGCRAAIDPAQRLIIISPLRLIRVAGSGEVARLFLCDPRRPDLGARARDSQWAAIAHRRLRAGHAFYFAFNVPQTMWVIQQGRPVDADHDGDGYLRVSDACALGENNRAVPYTDALHFLLANMIGRRPVPMIDAVPPREGRVASALLFFAGDDEGEANTQVVASDFMAARGLPYHINVMPQNGTFSMGGPEQARIEANGHEIAMHYNFMDGFEHPGGYRRHDVGRQARLFRETFGCESVCSVMHWGRWTGWAEPARWLSECGGRADNSFIGWTSPPLNPVNTIGFAFGSALPRYFWDDAAHGNERIDLLELPVVAYEVGYDGDEFLPEKIHQGLALASRYRLTFNFFWHPVWIARLAACRRAIDELATLIGEMAVPPVLMGPDQLCRWWEARARWRLRSASQADARVVVDAACDHPDGFVLKLATGGGPASACLPDGAHATFDSIRQFVEGTLDHSLQLTCSHPDHPFVSTSGSSQSSSSAWDSAIILRQ